jgi:hypothetical protein
MNIRYHKFILIAVLLIAVIGGMSAIAQQEPTLYMNASVSPSHINVVGTGTPEIAAITLTLSAPSISGNSADIALVLDASLSVDFELVKSIAREIISQLNSTDQVTVVSFSDLAQIATPLSTDKSAALTAIDSLIKGNETALGDGLLLGITEINTNKRTNTIPIVIVLTDGVHNIGSDPIVQAMTASEYDIPIYPVGISPIARDFVLNEIASLSGGTYFNSFNDSVHERLMSKMDRDVVANYIRVTQTLPGFLAYEDSEDEIPPAVNFGREVTQLEWFVRFLFEGASWEATYNISAKRDGSGTIFTAPSSIEYSARGGSFVIIDLLGDATGNLGAIGAGTGTAPPVTTPPNGGDTGSGDNGNEGTDGGNEGTEGGDEGTGDGNEGTEEVNDPDPIELVATVGFPTGAPTTYVVGEAIIFDASGTTGTLDKIEWDWTNNGTFDEIIEEENQPEDQLYRHAYERAGEYTVLVRFTGALGEPSDQLLTVTVVDGLRAGAAHTATDHIGNPTVPEWMEYYLDDGVITDEEVRDAGARFAADVFIPGTQYRLTNADLDAINDIHAVSLIAKGFQSTANAEAAGYVKIGEFIEGVGQHYVHAGYLSQPVDHKFPPILLYTMETGSTLTLAGVRFISTDENASLFQISGWTSHPASAHYADGTEQAVASADAAQTTNSENSPLLYWHPTLYSLTTWVNSINPDGIFASTNPNISSN